MRFPPGPMAGGCALPYDILVAMFADDPRPGPDPMTRLSQPVLETLSDCLRAQRAAGREPTPSLHEAITAAAAEARERNMPPEMLLVQLKHLAEEVGIVKELGQEETNALRERIVSACVAAYFAEN
jgi:hypothetical protein